ncbi:molybdopterin-dependent oxidoreductase [Methanosarcina horonobensis]|uniref:molybdopterin-dependent oxidoreductase n=1 Tax=Methanosarcina horonobensis TaxID=418008 RepID=UPI000AF70076|nr:molybdopterin-dependent oxidoreductase [Methanosarcina horonobensis]
MLIADIHPYSDLEHIKMVLELAEASGAKTFFLRPFVNSAGAELLEALTKRRSLEKIFENIDSGKIKTLFCLESDLLELAPDRETAVRILSKLDTLIVQTSRHGEFSRLADIVIASEHFYHKQGTVLNAEGRLLSTGGDSTLGFGSLSSLAAAFGKQLDFESVQKEIFDGFGLKEAGEFSLRAPEKFVPEPVEVETSCLKCELDQETYSRSFSESCPGCSSASLSVSLVYSLSPFMCTGLKMRTPLSN